MDKNLRSGCLSCLFIWIIMFFLIPLFFSFGMSGPTPVFLIFFAFFLIAVVGRLKRMQKEGWEKKESDMKEGEKSTNEPLQKTEYTGYNESMNVINAFRILGLSPNATYTKVNQTYYKLVQKVQKSKMPEEERQRKLKKLENAYNVLQDYYSKKY